MKHEFIYLGGPVELCLHHSELFRYLGRGQGEQSDAARSSEHLG